MTHHADLFTRRQLAALCTYSDLIHETRAQVFHASQNSAYADAVATYLALSLDRITSTNSALSRWRPDAGKESVNDTFSRQAMSMVWDYAEGCPFTEGPCSYSWSVGWVARVLDALPGQLPATAEHADATSTSPRSAVVCTDPPYYDNVGYADLSDFFYIWLRRSIRDAYPELFSTMLTPKGAELVADPFRSDGNRELAERRFEEGFERTFGNLQKAANPAYPLTVFYAFKQSEHDESGVASTGWETMLAGLLRSGFAVTATWPMRTELGNRMRNQASNALASSIVLACRPRSEMAGITDRRGFLAALHAELPQALRELQQGSIAPVDLAQAAIGPGMAVFSRYVKVVEPSGEAMPVRSALALINQVLDEVLAEQEGEFDADTRFAIKWFEQYGFDKAGYDPAEGLARATNVSVKGLEDAGILVARAGRVRLLRRSELGADWDPATDVRMPVWEVTQQLVRALWDDGSEAKAGDLVRRLGGIGEVARDLAYRLYSICERRGWADDALGFNALVTSWPEIARRAASPAPVQPELA